MLSVLCGLTLLALGHARPAAGQTTPGRVLVQDVVPEGLTTIPASQIMNYIKTRPGTEYQQSVVNDDVRRLSETRLFSDVRTWNVDTRDGHLIVHFHLTEYPSVVREVIYKHAGHLNKEELDGLTEVRKGMPLNPTLNKRGCIAIMQRYKEMGRHFASVTLEEGGKPGDSRVVYNITEGPVVRISNISFTGNTFVSGGVLYTHIDSSHSFLHLNLIGGTFNPGMVDHDARKLEEYYKSFGFQDVRVSRELIFAEDHASVQVVFHIHEGQRYQVADVQLDHIKAFDSAQIAALVKLHKGDWYDQHVVEGDKRTIADYYGFRGYQVIPHEELFYPETGLVRVHYQVMEKPPALVGEVKIIGNKVTKDRIIRRQLGLYPGQVLSFPEARLAEVRLLRLDLFEVNPEKGTRPTVTVQEPADPSNPYHDILVQVQEKPTGSLLFGVGFNSDAGVVGSIVLNEKNFDILKPPQSFADIFEGRAFRGAGQEFRAEAVPGSQLQRYTVSFREPYLFDQPYGFGTSAYYYDRIYNEYTEQRFGGRFSLDHQFERFPHWSVVGSLRVEDVRLNNVSIFAPPDITSAQGPSLLVGARGAVRYDDRDSYLRPTEGMMAELAYEQVFGDYTFPLVSFEASKYWTTYKRSDGSGKHVLVFHSQIGWAGSETPVFERFYAGGFRSIRGFSFRGVGPEINGFRVGGDFLFLNSLEYQVPIKANDHLYMVAFLDTGTVESNVSIHNYRVAAGVGARIIVPALGPVPIALDFGFPIVRGPNDQTQVFSFWVGLFH
jgi:outer membrane protein assembly factor BamA